MKLSDLAAQVEALMAEHGDVDFAVFQQDDWRRVKNGMQLSSMGVEPCIKANNKVIPDNGLVPLNVVKDVAGFKEVVRNRYKQSFQKGEGKPYLIIRAG